MQHSTGLRRLLTFVLLILMTASCATVITPPPPAEVPKVVAKPKVLKKSYVLLDHKYFIVHYDPAFRLARYVKYVLTKEMLQGPKFKRRDRFKPDPLLAGMKLQAVHPKEYAKTGYHRGHLAPAGDFAFSREASDATFVMSNMVPQRPSLNTSAWKQLEDQVRKWACGEEQLTIITGPILEKGLSSLGSGLPVPRHFFKIVIDETPPRKALAFVYHQEDKGKVMHQRMVPVNELDLRLQENFSALLEDDERRPAQVAEWRECG